MLTPTLMAGLLWILLATICPQQKVALNLEYVPSTPAALKNPVCTVGVEAYDPATGTLLGDQQVSLTDEPQQVIIDLTKVDACGPIRFALREIEGCTDPTGLRGSSLEVEDGPTGRILRTIELDLQQLLNEKPVGVALPPPGKF